MVRGGRGGRGDGSRGGGGRGDGPRGGGPRGGGWTRDEGGIVLQLLISVPLPSWTTRTKTWNATSTATTAIPSTSNGGASGPQ